MFHYVILCLFDITATGVLQYRQIQQNLFQRNQHRNWQVIQQLVSLRTQPIYITEPHCQTVQVESYNFGSLFKEQQRVWACSFGIEPAELYQENSNPIHWLENDFDRIPMLTDLTESVKFAVPCTQTQGQNKNICFYTEDQWDSQDFMFEFNSTKGK
jgi:hypothetical protein